MIGRVGVGVRATKRDRGEQREAVDRHLLAAAQVPQDRPQEGPQVHGSSRGIHQEG